MSLYGEMRRSFEAEILDSGGQQPEMLARVHRALSLTHSLLGNHGAILRALRRDGQAVRRVLDIGCGHGGLLEKVRRQIGADVLGVDLRPPERGVGEFPIFKLDAVREVLPRADVAVCVCLAHHLRDDEFVEMIRNVGRTCGRFVILDLVRHRVPMLLFSAAAPLCFAESECAGWAPVHPAGAHAGGVSRVDCAGGGGDGREFSTLGGASLDPANGGYSLLTSEGARVYGGAGMGRNWTSRDFLRGLWVFQETRRG